MGEVAAVSLLYGTGGRKIPERIQFSLLYGECTLQNEVQFVFVLGSDAKNANDADASITIWWCRIGSAYRQNGQRHSTSRF